MNYEEIENVITDCIREAACKDGYWFEKWYWIRNHETESNIKMKTADVFAKNEAKAYQEGVTAWKIGEKLGVDCGAMRAARDAGYEEGKKLFEKEEMKG